MLWEPIVGAHPELSPNWSQLYAVLFFGLNSLGLACVALAPSESMPGQGSQTNSQTYPGERERERYEKYKKEAEDKVKEINTKKNKRLNHRSRGDEEMMEKKEKLERRRCAERRLSPNALTKPN